MQPCCQVSPFTVPCGPLCARRRVSPLLLSSVFSCRDKPNNEQVQEFPAHSANVNCLRIGRKSSQVLVTGGDDKKVNVWAIGKPNAILSLAGHTSPVESVCFDSNDEVVVAGAGSGTVKLWDLEQAKVIRTLTGHRSNCVAVDFHPYGDFFASGSMDTNLKVWDIRRKSCIQTYKGHTKTILQVARVLRKLHMSFLCLFRPQ